MSQWNSWYKREWDYQAWKGDYESWHGTPNRQWKTWDSDETEDVHVDADTEHQNRPSDQWGRGSYEKRWGHGDHGDVPKAVADAEEKIFSSPSEHESDEEWQKALESAKARVKAKKERLGKGVFVPPPPKNSMLPPLPKQFSVPSPKAMPIDPTGVQAKSKAVLPTPLSTPPPDLFEFLPAPSSGHDLEQDGDDQNQNETQIEEQNDQKETQNEERSDGDQNQKEPQIETQGVDAERQENETARKVKETKEKHKEKKEKKEKKNKKEKTKDAAKTMDHEKVKAKKSKRKEKNITRNSSSMSRSRKPKNPKVMSEDDEQKNIQSKEHQNKLKYLKEFEDYVICPTCGHIGSLMKDRGVQTSPPN